jgi:hypothetical protein
MFNIQAHGDSDVSSSDAGAPRQETHVSKSCTRGTQQTGSKLQTQLGRITDHAR